MIQDIEEESKTKFSMDVEFSFSFKGCKDKDGIFLSIFIEYVSMIMWWQTFSETGRESLSLFILCCRIIPNDYVE